MSGRKSFLLLSIALTAAPLVLAHTVSIAGLIVPAFADLTIKKRQSFGATSTTRSTEVLYLKGARHRREFLFEYAGRREHGAATVTQCDRRRSVLLNPDAKLYAASELKEWSEPAYDSRAVPEADGADVTTTFDAVDTGERRQVGRYLARRVRTTITVEPSPGANAAASRSETDGWYIDLPGLGCSSADTSAYLATAEILRPGARRDRHHYRTKGAARRGYAIEETRRQSAAGGIVERVELIELSEHPLNPSLFEIPHDYRPAMPLVRGGHDLTKPDTLGNRLRGYWDELTLAARAMFR